MPLVIDPSSTCDICLEHYSSQRQCHAIPCGHTFCGQCLPQINGHKCPLCRANMRATNSRVGNKLCVDFAPATPASSSHALSAQQQNHLGAYVLRKCHEISKTTTIQAAIGIALEAINFLECTPSNPYQIRLKRLLLQCLDNEVFLILTDNKRYSLAVRASYESRIQELEETIIRTTMKLHMRSHLDPLNLQAELLNLKILILKEKVHRKLQCLPKELGAVER